MKFKNAFLILGIAALSYGCGDNTDKATSAKTNADKSIHKAEQSNAPDLGSSVAPQSGVENIVTSVPVHFENVCAAQDAITEAGIQMGGSRQCVPLESLQTTSELRTGPTASFARPVAITTDGFNLYVVDSDRIRKVSIASSKVTTLAQLIKPTDHSAGPNAIGFPGITTDGKNLYIADQEHNEVRKVVIATGEMTTLTGFNKQECPPFGYCALQGITFDGRNVYVLGVSDIFKIDPVTGNVEQWKLNEGPGLHPMPINITTDGRYLYVLKQAVVNSGDVTGPEIKEIEINTGRKTTLTHLGISIDWGSYITTDGKYLYITVPVRHCVYQVEISSGQMSTLAGSGKSHESTDGIGEEATFLRPTGITSDGRNLYVSDGGGIRKIAISSHLVTTEAASAPGASVDGIGLTGYSLPVDGMASDGQYLYVTDPSVNPIRRIELGTDTISNFVHDATVTGESQEDLASKGLSGYPKGLVVESGKLYIADYDNHVIRQVDIATGKMMILAGSGKRGMKDGIGEAASFNYPYDIASDGTNIYVTDYDNNTIRQVEVATGKVTTLAGSGKVGATDGIGKEASFSSPRGLAFEAGMLYVADYNNNLIRQIQISSGKVTTLAGSGEPGYKDGVGRKAIFRQPSDIVADGDKLYVADTYNNNIRQIDIATGKVTTLAGPGAKGAQDGVEETISFNQPKALAKDRGQLYVADSNHFIRSIDLATGLVKTLTLKEVTHMANDVVTGNETSSSNVGGASGAIVSKPQLMN